MTTLWILFVVVSLIAMGGVALVIVLEKKLNRLQQALHYQVGEQRVAHQEAVALQAERDTWQARAVEAAIDQAIRTNPAALQVA